MSEMEEFKKQLEPKDDLINTLQSSLKLKDDQIETIKDSIKLKNDQIQTLESSIKIKEEKIGALEKTIQLKEEELKSGGGSSGDASDVEDLKKEIDILNGELAKADEELEKLELENETLRKGSASGDSGGASASGIRDFTEANIPKEDILAKMKDILASSLHKVTIAVPSITDLQDLYLYEVRSSVNMQISCIINPGIEIHSELLEEFESLDNISIRSYEGEDRYVIIADGAEMLFAVIGKSENNHLVFHTRDEAHIKLFNSMITEAWLRSRKI